MFQALRPKPLMAPLVQAVGSLGTRPVRPTDGWIVGQERSGAVRPTDSGGRITSWFAILRPHGIRPSTSSSSRAEGTGRILNNRTGVKHFPLIRKFSP